MCVCGELSMTTPGTGAREQVKEFLILNLKKSWDIGHWSVLTTIVRTVATEQRWNSSEFGFFFSRL